MITLLSKSFCIWVALPWYSLLIYIYIFYLKKKFQYIYYRIGVVPNYGEFLYWGRMSNLYGRETYLLVCGVFGLLVTQEPSITEVPITLSCGIRLLFGYPYWPKGMTATRILASLIFSGIGNYYSWQMALFLLFHFLLLLMVILSCTFLFLVLMNSSFIKKKNTK